MNPVIFDITSVNDVRNVLIKSFSRSTRKPNKGKWLFQGHVLVREKWKQVSVS